MFLNQGYVNRISFQQLFYYNNTCKFSFVFIPQISGFNFFKLLKSKKHLLRNRKEGEESVNKHGHLTEHLFTEVNRSIILLYLFCHRQDLSVLKSKIKYTLATAPNQIFLQKKAGRVKLKVHTMHDGQLRVSSVGQTTGLSRLRRQVLLVHHCVLYHCRMNAVAISMEIGLFCINIKHCVHKTSTFKGHLALTTKQYKHWFKFFVYDFQGFVGINYLLMSKYCQIP